MEFLQYGNDGMRTTSVDVRAHLVEGFHGSKTHSRFGRGQKHLKNCRERRNRDTCMITDILSPPLSSHRRQQAAAPWLSHCSG